jgi:CRISPR-associated protein Cmr1
MRRQDQELFIPLPGEMHAKVGKAKHPGLLLTRLTPWTWDKGDVSPFKGEERLRFLERVASAKWSNGHLAALHRRQAWVMNTARKTASKAFNLTLNTPLAIGLSSPTPIETGLHLDLLTGLPVLPASGLKGLIRAWLRQGMGMSEEKTDALLAGLVLLDAFPMDLPSLKVDVLTPHHKDYYGSQGSDPALDTDDPEPTTFLAVVPGSRFKIRMWLRARKERKDEVEEQLDEISAALAAALEQWGAGGKTAAGYGRFTNSTGPSPQKIETICVSLKVVTPVFVGAAEPDKLDRHWPLRPASVRGVLRDWFRRMMADIVGPGRDEDWAKNLFRLEEYVFGSAAGQASRLLVESPDTATTNGPLFKRIPAGIAYLGYGPYQHRRGQGQVQAAEAIQPGQKLELILRFRWRPEDGEKIKKAVRDLVLGSFWLWTHLGGLGKRTRRGFGSLWVTDVKGPVPNAWAGQFGPLADMEALKKRILEGLRQVQTSFSDAATKILDSDAVATENHARWGYSSLAHSQAVIVPTATAKGERAWEEALNDIGLRYKCFRNTLDRRRFSGLPPLEDYFTVKDFLLERTKNLKGKSIPRAAFGLPLQFYFRSVRNQTAQVQAVRPEEKEYREDKFDRRTSPLVFKLIPVGDQVMTLVLYMPGPLLPEGAKLRVSTLGGRRQEELEVPNDKIIREFLERLGKK